MKRAERMRQHPPALTTTPVARGQQVMASDHSIPPFPADIDRQRFGDWLSGFTDGEGCFVLAGLTDPRRTGVTQPVATFQISLRADDTPILRLIQSYFECGGLRHQTSNQYPEQRPAFLNVKDQCHYRVRRVHDLATIIVPHFDAHPLRAKKANDYRIWREGVLLIEETQRSGPILTGRGRSRGSWRKWTPERLAHFQTLHDALRAVRVYNSSDVPDLTPPPPSCPLFDDLP